MSKVQTILLTGASGMVGSALLNELALKENYVVKAVTRDKDKHIKNADQISVGNLANKDFVISTVKGCDIIIHCAAENKQADLYKTSNVDATKNLVEAANLNNVSKFIHISTIKVVGNTVTQYIDEDAVCSPSNEYEQTKYNAEQIVLQKSDANETYILRPSFVFDKNRIDNIANLNWPRILLKGNENTNLVYVKNVTAAILYALQNNLDYKIYNVTTDDIENLTYRQFLRHKLHKPLFIPSLPARIVHTLRILKNGFSLMGNKHYRSERIQDEGFTFPYDYETALKDLGFDDPA